MPALDHVDVERRRGSNGVSSATAAKGSGKRKGIPVEINHDNSSILSPFLYHLPSLSGIPSLKGFLPTSPNNHAESSTSISGTEGNTAVWQEADLGDGGGRVPLLLISSRSHALQIFSLSSSIPPDDPLVQEVFPAPEEVFNLPVITYDEATVKTTLGEEQTAGSEEQVIGARFLEPSSSSRDHGPLVALLTLAPARRTAGHIALAIVSLRTGKAIRRVDIGMGVNASATSSRRAIAIVSFYSSHLTPQSISHPTPSLHILDPISLAPLYLYSELPANPRTSLPTFAVSGRLLALATSEPPRTLGSDGLGSILTSRSTSRIRATSETHQSRLLPRPQDPSQGDLLTSAVEIGGGVARGVWAGIKMGAKAANKARNGRLARSAPAESSSTFGDDEERESDGSEARSLDESSGAEAPTPLKKGGDWVKVVDLFPRTGQEPETIAHFQLPFSRSIGPPLPSEAAPGSARQARPLSFLEFSPDDTQLFVSTDGRAFHLLDLHPAGPDKAKVNSKGMAWHLYELRRGNTAAIVSDVRWSKDRRWLGVGTGRGTIHVFPIQPSGGPPSASSHATMQVTNPEQLFSLSTIVSPFARLRPPRLAEDEVHPRPYAPSVFTFTEYRANPLAKGTFFQDVAVYRPRGNELELSRLSVRQVTRSSAATRDTQRRGSALSDMMRAKAGFIDQTDLGLEHNVKARWILPDGGEEALASSVKAKRIPPHLTSRSLARAEIQTHSNSLHVLPRSIYLSHQIDFFAARPIDEFSPLSIMDIEARTERQVFRHEVEARAASPEITSFDGPLSSALHSVIESRPSPQLPGLPNGHPGRKWRSAIPIRHVAAGLGEGVDRVRREYARAQHSRSRRRLSEVQANQLSFEEDAVFASGVEDDGASSPSSGILPATNTESSVAGEDEADTGEWAERWEEEYQKAVDDDGGPDDLVLGLLDEEEEERRQWQERQKILARQFAK
ncbi:hypothetical protein BCR39DRAFT_527125 [Naematelia encephala]|uniref:BCAS3 WD40 domain-containing protein n=1 Tax=Naematelia encephala TaxID=71784 RepID=A0A1Y2B8V2_9TREE|nr:hypothetical protein BCR39DRAFT_527125 [Naematelia encephala]